MSRNKSSEFKIFLNKARRTSRSIRMQTWLLVKSKKNLARASRGVSHWKRTHRGNDFKGKKK